MPTVACIKKPSRCAAPFVCFVGQVVPHVYTSGWLEGLIEWAQEHGAAPTSIRFELFDSLASRPASLGQMILCGALLDGVCVATARPVLGGCTWYPPNPSCFCGIAAKPSPEAAERAAPVLVRGHLPRGVGWFELGLVRSLQRSLALEACTVPHVLRALRWMASEVAANPPRSARHFAGVP